MNPERAQQGAKSNTGSARSWITPNASQTFFPFARFFVTFQRPMLHVFGDS